ncbi:MAG: hypothetical protein KAT09_03480 [Candidatus Aegiribacteria sp.]|nr:hypothetical protein [Candidatus Aegiribacteria sp.]
MTKDTKFQENVAKRGHNAESIFFASFIAGLNSFGILNQAVVNLASRRAGKYLARLGELTDFSESDMLKGAKMKVEAKFDKSLKVLNKVLPISEDIEMKKDNEDILISIRNSTCKFCPKGVGEAELKGTLCPFPSLIESFNNEIWKSEDIQLVKERATPLMVKEGDWCIFKFRIKKDSE